MGRNWAGVLQFLYLRVEEQASKNGFRQVEQWFIQ